MISLPIVHDNRLRHLETDYMVIILKALGVPFEDKRLISLMAKESVEEHTQSIQDSVGLLQHLFDSMTEDAFIDYMAPILIKLSAEYGAGIQWDNDLKKSVKLEFGETFERVLRDSL